MTKPWLVRNDVARQSRRHGAKGISMRTLLVAIVATVGVGAVACGEDEVEPRSWTSTELAAELKQQIEDENPEAEVDVFDCPSVEEPQDGDEVTCTVRVVNEGESGLPDGAAEVTFDDEGNFSYSLES